jgi:hypothetical protein
MNHPALKFLAEYALGPPERLPPLPRTKLDGLTEIQIQKAIDGDTCAFMAIVRLLDLYDPTIQSVFDTGEDD